jgi:hypothetical protein
VSFPLRSVEPGNIFFYVRNDLIYGVYYYKGYKTTMFVECRISSELLVVTKDLNLLHYHNNTIEKRWNSYHRMFKDVYCPISTRDSRKA